MYLSRVDAPPALQLFWPGQSHSTLWNPAGGTLADRLAASALVGSADFDMKVARYAKWVTDIGLRPAREIRQAVHALVAKIPAERRAAGLARLSSFDLFTAEIAAHGGITPLAAFDHAAWTRSWLERGEHQVVTHAIAQYVDGLGSHEDARRISVAVADCEKHLPRTGTAAFLLLHAGCVLATDADERSRDVFDQTETRMVAAWDRFFVLLRGLTAEVKRLDGSRTEELRERAYVLADALSTTYGEPAGALARAVLTNLDALRALQVKDFASAAVLIDTARDLVDVARHGDTGYPWSVASRYYVQVCQNWVRLKLGTPETVPEAIREMERLVAFCRAEEPDSLAEALTFLGIGLCKVNRFDAAIQPLREAERLLTGDISLIRRNTVVGTLIAANDALGRTGEVQRWVAELQPGDELLDGLLAA